MRDLRGALEVWKESLRRGGLDGGGGGRSEFRAKPTMKTDGDDDDGDEGLMRRAGRRGRDDGEGV